MKLSREREEVECKDYCEFINRRFGMQVRFLNQFQGCKLDMPFLE
jgi:hypothetical protein